MLGGHAADRAALAELLGLVFQYDARKIISKVESHVVLSRYAARGVLRQVALLNFKVMQGELNRVTVRLRGSGEFERNVEAKRLPRVELQGRNLVIGKTIGANNDLVSPGLKIDEFECAIFIGGRGALGLFIEAG